MFFRGLFILFVLNVKRNIQIRTTQFSNKRETFVCREHKIWNIFHNIYVGHYQCDENWTPIEKSVEQFVRHAIRARLLVGGTVSGDRHGCPIRHCYSEFERTLESSRFVRIIVPSVGWLVRVRFSFFFISRFVR